MKGLSHIRKACSRRGKAKEAALQMIQKKTTKRERARERRKSMSYWRL